VNGNAAIWRTENTDFSLDALKAGLASPEEKAPAVDLANLADNDTELCFSKGRKFDAEESWWLAADARL
jgi:hypothetical protein